MGILGKIAGSVLKEVVQVGKTAVMGGGMTNTFSGGIPSNYGNPGSSARAGDFSQSLNPNNLGFGDSTPMSGVTGSTQTAATGTTASTGTQTQTCRQACAEQERAARAVCNENRRQAREMLKNSGCPSVVRPYKRSRRSKCCAPRRRTCTPRRKTSCGCSGTYRKRSWRPTYVPYGYDDIHFMPRAQQAAAKRKLVTSIYSPNKRRRMGFNY